MKKKATDRSFLKKAFYPGGAAAMGAFISSQLKYPPEALKNGIKGIVQVRITIDSQGKVIQTELIHGLGYGCDEEAMRVAALLQFEVPKNRGIKAKFFKKINIKFGFTKKIVTPTPTSVQASGSFSTTSTQITSYTYTYTTKKS